METIERRKGLGYVIPVSGHCMKPIASCPTEPGNAINKSLLHVHAFTIRTLKGNLVTLVFEAENLDTRAMQQITHHMNLSWRFSCWPGKFLTPTIQ
jgi:hypothetical protein